MTRQLSNLVMGIVSALILLFIVVAFYDAFTRPPVQRSTPTVESSTGTIAGVSTTPPPSVSPSPSEPSAADAYANSDESTPTPNTSTPPADPNAASTAANSDADQTASGQALKERPALRDALPPVPAAPPSPVATVPPLPTDSQVFNATNSQTHDAIALPLNNPGSTSGASGGDFPAPINSFPAPNSGNPSSLFPPPSSNPVAPAPNSAPSAEPNSDFPVPEQSQQGGLFHDSVKLASVVTGVIVNSPNVAQTSNSFTLLRPAVAADNPATNAQIEQQRDFSDNPAVSNSGKETTATASTTMEAMNPGESIKAQPSAASTEPKPTSATQSEAKESVVQKTEAKENVDTNSPAKELVMKDTLASENATPESSTKTTESSVVATTSTTASSTDPELASAIPTNTEPDPTVATKGANSADTVASTDKPSESMTATPSTANEPNDQAAKAVLMAESEKAKAPSDAVKAMMIDENSAKNSISSEAKTDTNKEATTVATGANPSGISPAKSIAEKPRKPKATNTEDKRLKELRKERDALRKSLGIP